MIRRFALTGHRPGRRLDPDAASKGMQRIVDRVTKEDGEEIRILAGGADGADKLWWLTAVTNNADYEIYVPRGYKDNYNLGNWFDSMLDGAEEIHWTQKADKPYGWKMNFLRNADMINGSTDGIICTDIHPSDLLKEAKGGTKHGSTLMWGRNRRNGYRVLWLNSLTGEVTWIWKT